MTNEPEPLTLSDQLANWSEECARHYITTLRDERPFLAAHWARAALLGYELRDAITRAQFSGEGA